MEQQVDGAKPAVVLDLGRQSRKRVKALRNGEGSLLHDVKEAVAHLREGGVIGADAQTVIVVVERKGVGMTFPFLPPMVR